MNRKIVFIGHSIINGYPLTRDKCFVGLLQKEMDYDIINAGANGETTNDIMKRFAYNVIDLHPDLVFIMTGTNDFVYDEATVSQVYNGTIQMAEAAAEEGITPVLMTPLPVDPVKASFMWMGGIDYDKINRQLTELTDMIKSSPYKHIDLNGPYSTFGQFVDGLHPTAAGHRFMADIISQYIISKGAL